MKIRLCIVLMFLFTNVYCQSISISVMAINRSALEAENNSTSRTFGEFSQQIGLSINSEMEVYFEGKAYENQEELGLLVVELLNSKAGIEMEEYPLLQPMVSETGSAEKVENHQR